jgi:hypothetical protein
LTGLFSKARESATLIVQLKQPAAICTKGALLKAKSKNWDNRTIRDVAEKTVF